MKVGKKKRIHLYVLGYLLELIIKSGDLDVFFFEIWQIWDLCLDEKPFE
jgi:hypothetical protein